MAYFPKTCSAVFGEAKVRTSAQILRRLNHSAMNRLVSVRCAVVLLCLSLKLFSLHKRNKVVCNLNVSCRFFIGNVSFMSKHNM